MSEISPDFWHKIWDVIHILAKTYLPTPENKEAFVCLFQCLAVLLPCPSARNNLRFFMTQCDIHKYISCNNKTFEYTHKLHNYINLIKKRQGQNTRTATLDEALEIYNFIDKTRWANATWFLLHFLAANIPANANRNIYKAMIVCIRFLLPCSECRSHMKEYLALSVIDPYVNPKDRVFLWTWKFHNEVNLRLKKPQVSYDEAYRYYKINERGFSMIDE
jgi:hypothetical protein